LILAYEIGEKAGLKYVYVGNVYDLYVHQPAVSGLFYPKEKRQLEEQILSFLKKAKKEDLGRLKILIVPHAGIVYSGQTAAFCFKQVEKENFKRVVLLGASHT
jgi:AmmeMemoRadiSam system protein B